jgi:hypothetical protein
MSKCLKYHFPAGDSRNALPPYAKKDGFVIPCVPANFERLGILVRVDATPDAGKIITQSHGELVEGQWIEVIDEQLTAEEIEAAAQAAKQAAKPLVLKQAENNYFALIDTINIAETLAILYTDNSTEIMQKAESAGLSMTKKSYYGMLLQNAIHEVEINGGTWYDLPEQPHNLT